MHRIFDFDGGGGGGGGRPLPGGGGRPPLPGGPGLGGLMSLNGAEAIADCVVVAGQRPARFADVLDVDGPLRMHAWVPGRMLM